MDSPQNYCSQAPQGYPTFWNCRSLCLYHRTDHHLIVSPAEGRVHPRGSFHGEALRRIGGEVGVTTGRNRRCGWFDAPIARYATRVNGLTDFFLTKLDVLTGWEKIPVCVAYDIDGVRVEELPASQTDFHHAKPIYEYLDGWKEDISDCKTFEDLPKNAQDYVKYLEKISGAPMSAIGVGPGRNQTIVVKAFI